MMKLGKREAQLVERTFKNLRDRTEEEENLLRKVRETLKGDAR